MACIVLTILFARSIVKKTKYHVMGVWTLKVASYPMFVCLEERMRMEIFVFGTVDPTVLGNSKCALAACFQTAAKKTMSVLTGMLI